MVKGRWALISSFLAISCLSLGLDAQAQAPSSGEVIVRLIQPIDSATMHPGQSAPATISSSTNPAIAKNASAAVELVSDPASGGFAVRLTGIGVNGQMVRTSSSQGTLPNTFLNRGVSLQKKAVDPPIAPAGSRVFLIPNLQIQFAIGPPSPAMDSPKPRVQSGSPPVATSQLPFVNWTAKVYPPSAQDVKTACEATDNNSQAYCYAVLMSLYDSYLFAVDAYSATLPCFPQDATAEQLKKAFLDYTIARPTQLGGDIALFYSLAINEAFPCPKAPAAKHSAAKKKSQ